MSAFPACQRRPAGGPLFPARFSGGAGFIDARGRVVIPARFENAGLFREDRGAVQLNGRWGYVDRRGRLVIPTIHRSVGEFAGGVAVVDSGLPSHPYGLIDSQGAWVLAPRFRSLAPGDESGHLFIGQTDAGSPTGFYNRAGEMVLGPFEYAYPFREGLARVNAGGNAVVDSSGTLSLRGTNFESTRFSEGLIPVRQDRKVGYMDASGTLVVEARYDQGGDFREGLAPVMLEGHWMWINRSGAVTADFPAGIVHAMPLSEGLSLVTADREGGGRGLGFVDRQGRWAIRPEWDDAEPFADGLALVGRFKNEETAYMDPSGRVVWTR